MPATEYTPLIQRKVIIDHSRPMIELLISDLRMVQDRYSNVGEQLEALREQPARYSSLQRPLQSLILDFARSLTLVIRSLDALKDTLSDHEHDFSVSLTSGPRRV